MSTTPDVIPCIHACSTGCGRTYDGMWISAVDMSTVAYCIPCFMAFAHQVMTAIVEADNPAVQQVVSENPLGDVMYVTEEDSYAVARGFSDPTAEDEFEFDGMD